MLWYLDLNDNNLTAPIPKSLVKLPNLEVWMLPITISLGLSLLLHHQ
ncbi:hypothetical protein Goklo_006513 [Gossypium klotzschianum]|uniref:Uncharacterized protein n=1 Tax=Gossypium klotzschianum TaxID=34286 RepID=A0A7J8VIH1_9ROSI|nr:hypothetical protein [Gossypium klotzschianum]